MKLALPVEDLQKAVRLAGLPVDRKQTFGISNSLLLEAVRGGLTVSGTNLNSSVSMLVDATVERAGKVAVNSANLWAVVSKLDADKTVKLELHEKSLEFRSAKSKYNFTIHAATDYPKLHQPSGKPFKVVAHDLKRLIDTCAHAMDPDNGRPHLWGVLLEFGGGHGVGLACDGKRLARLTLDMKGPKAKMMVPAPAVAVLSEFCGALDEDEKVDVATKDGRLFVWTGDLGYMVQLAQCDQLIDVEKVMPKRFKYSAVVYRDQLLAALRRLTAIGDDKKRVTFSLRAGALDVSASNQQSGAGKETLGADYSGDKVERILGAGQVADLASVAELDVLTFKFTDSGLDPVIIVAGDVTGLMMPMVAG